MAGNTQIHLGREVPRSQYYTSTVSNILVFSRNAVQSVDVTYVIKIESMNIEEDNKTSLVYQ